jgi:NAD(P)-dependent dehydrogenase (short-subunit alcohol dehydrogenase family)
VIIVTGANSPLGIGRASAHQFASGACKALYLCDYDSTHLSTHKRELNELYPDVKIHICQLDVSDDASVRELCEDAISKYGRLDVFFANAGITGDNKLFWESDDKDFMKVIKTNALSVYLAFKYASRAMLITSPSKRYPSGSLIATASVAGIRSNAGSSSYSASKAAVISLCQTIAYQLAGQGIRVNAVCPGIIETGMTKIMYDMARERGTEKKIGQLNPLQRGAVADEVARVVSFLGSEEASYVNGQVNNELGTK